MAPFSKTRYTTQYMQNWGFDDEFKIPTVENLVYNSVTGTMDRMVQQGQILPTSNLNPSITISNVDSTVSYTKVIVKTINGVNYSKTLSYNVSDELLSMTAWTT